jgi:hypothetical protein
MARLNGNTRQVRQRPRISNYGRVLRDLDRVRLPSVETQTIQLYNDITTAQQAGVRSIIQLKNILYALEHGLNLGGDDAAEKNG